MRKIYFYIHIAIKNNFNYHFKIISDQGYYYTKHKNALETACMDFNRDTKGQTFQSSFQVTATHTSVLDSFCSQTEERKKRALVLARGTRA